jgi:glycosyltransferase involved in cell wall biosynthesis
LPVSRDRRLLVVVQRYGDVAGGAEQHARELVRRLVPHFDISVATTAARDYWTWENEFIAGETRIDGIPVLRFAVTGPRTSDFKDRERRAFAETASLADERAFIESQGPVTPELLEYLYEAAPTYGQILFFTYIYYPTVYGLPLVPERSVLVPTAHDEPALRLTSYKPLFHAARAIAFNTEEERRLVHGRFGNARVPNEVVGVGVDVPADRSGARFRQKHGITGPLFLYVGRVVESKGADQLFSHWGGWAATPPALGAKLVVIGKAEMPIPRRDDVVHLGFVSEQEKYDAMDAADAVIVPERYSSLSMVTLEAWACGKPVICSAYCNVLRGMSRRSGGGLYYADHGEFSELLDLLVADPSLGKRLGAAGAAFVGRTYTWPVVVEKYLDLFAEVRRRLN